MFVPTGDAFYELNNGMRRYRTRTSILDRPLGVITMRTRKSAETEPSRTIYCSRSLLRLIPLDFTRHFTV